VAAEVANNLNVPLGVVPVRKLGVPFSPELAFGAIAKDVVVLDEELVQRMGLTEAEIESVLLREGKELKRRERLYQGRLPSSLKNETVIVVDDGVATGATVLSALRSVKKQQPKHIIVAAPVCAPEISEKIKGHAKLVCLQAPHDFMAVGQYYQNFEQVTDAEVLTLVKKI
jgi:putative phosphoribosyl transferase